MWFDPAINDGTDSVDYVGSNVRHGALTLQHDYLPVYAESIVALRNRPGLVQIARSLPWEDVRAMLGPATSPPPYKRAATCVPRPTSPGSQT
jgi:hypothetical protein